MAIVLDGTNGINTPDLESAGPVVGTTGTFSGAVRASGVTTNLYPLVSGTAVASTSGTSIDFTGIPSWVKRVTVMFSGVSTNGTSNVIVQIGAGSIETSGYSGAFAYLINAGSVQGVGLSSGFLIGANMSGGAVLQGVIALSNINSNTWSGASNASLPTTPAAMFGSGTKTLSGTLDRVRITTVNGTDTFDAGSINIMYE